MERRRMEVLLKQRISDKSYGGRIIENGEDIIIYQALSPRFKGFETLGRNSKVSVIVEKHRFKKGYVGINIKVIEDTGEAFYQRHKKKKATITYTNEKGYAFAEVEGFEGRKFLHQNANEEIVVADLYVGQTIECDLMVAGDKSFISQAKMTLTNEEQELYDMFMNPKEED